MLYLIWAVIFILGMFPKNKFRASGKLLGVFSSITYTILFFSYLWQHGGFDFFAMNTPRQYFFGTVSAGLYFVGRATKLSLIGPTTNMTPDNTSDRLTKLYFK